MEESNKLARTWICSADVGTFVAIAVQADEGEIFKHSRPSMLTCNDVDRRERAEDRRKQEGGNTHIGLGHDAGPAGKRPRFTSYGDRTASS